eukprot:scaffold176832_cov35-Tisochrysis_lutea.AAC.8
MLRKTVPHKTHAASKLPILPLGSVPPGPDVSAPSCAFLQTGWQALHFAAWGASADVVSRLIKAGANVECQDDKVGLGFR